ncbi:MAG: MotA/TolQ/ExbB proton channel family protein [Myxococcales bacterium]|nr:MotA/TolQ/ExbB proton channel family protein [Myxococcales bacterium]
MNLTQKLLSLTLVGAEWVLWLLLLLSLLSIAVMIERGLYYFSLRFDFAALAEDLRRLLLDGKFGDARKQAQGGRGPVAFVAQVGLEEAERGADAVESAMLGAKARMKLGLERNLAFLGTLGSNAPFIGLFGTVLGIIKAFHDLAGNQAGGIQVVMAGISEALVATAVGLLVAIPAVVGFNVYNRRVRAITSQIDVVAQVILAALRAELVSHSTDQSKPTTAKVSATKSSESPKASDTAEEKK